MPCAQTLWTFSDLTSSPGCTAGAERTHRGIGFTLQQISLSFLEGCRDDGIRLAAL